jgi:hypothetical protein
MHYQTLACYLLKLIRSQALGVFLLHASMTVNGRRKGAVQEAISYEAINMRDAGST